MSDTAAKRVAARRRKQKPVVSEPRPLVTQQPRPPMSASQVKGEVPGSQTIGGQRVDNVRS